MTVHPLKTAGLEIRRVDDDVLVHDPTHDKVHVMNRTAARVLELCDGAHAPGEIARLLSAATGAELPVVIRDVDLILTEFARLRLI